MPIKYDLFSGPGRVPARLRQRDWSTSRLGDPDNWPIALKTLVRVVLNAKQPMYVAWGPKLNLIYNDAYAEILAAKDATALASPFWEVWSEIAKEFGPVIDDALAGKSTYAENVAITVLRSGREEQAWFTFSISPVRDDQDSVAGIYCVCTETTDQLLAEHTRAAEYAQLHRLFAQAPGFMALLTGPEHVFELVNDAFVRLAGGHRNFIGLPVREVLPEVGRQGFFALMDRAYATGESFVGRGMRIALQLESGSEPVERFVNFIYQPIADAHGKVSGIFVEGSDITDQHRSELALRALNETLEQRVAERTAKLSANEARLRSIFETAHQYQGFMTVEGILIDSNQKSLERIASKLDDVLGRPFWESPWFSGTPGMPETVRNAVAQVAAGATYRQEIAVNLPGGRRTFDFEMRPAINDSGEIIGIVPEAVDITDRRLAEDALRHAQKMEAIGQLTGGIAHDFNNLLAGMIGNLEMLQFRIAQDRMTDVARYVDSAMTVANRAAALTHRLLAYSRRQTLDPKPLDANALLVSLDDLIRRTVGPAIHVETALGADLWPTLCDPDQLENALLNLVINSRDAMPDGGKLTIETCNVVLDAEYAARHPDVAPGRYVRISVVDTGEGMEPETSSRVFDPFFTTKALGAGTGLGLPMVHGFVKQSRGHITLQSKKSRGTTLGLYLPKLQEESALSSAPVAPARPAPALSKPTVLIVDDDVVIRGLITEVLKDLGYQIIDVPHAQAGLDVLQSPQHVDLLVTDIGLAQGMNGRQLADAGRTIRPDLKVLFITGYDESAAVSDGLMGPGMQVMTKPFLMVNFASKVRGMVEGAAAGK